MNKSIEETRLGLELHETETTIAIGKQAVGELLMFKPVDLEAVESQRIQIHEARLVRNALRSQLEQAKAGVSRSYRWY